MLCGHNYHSGGCSCEAPHGQAAPSGAQVLSGAEHWHEDPEGLHLKAPATLFATLCKEELFSNYCEQCWLICEAS